MRVNQPENFTHKSKQARTTRFVLPSLLALASHDFSHATALVLAVDKKSRSLKPYSLRYEHRRAYQARYLLWLAVHVRNAICTQPFLGLSRGCVTRFTQLIVHMTTAHRKCLEEVFLLLGVGKRHRRLVRIKGGISNKPGILYYTAQPRPIE